jgi:hypothetical protein
LFCVTNEIDKGLLEWVVQCGLHGVQLGGRQSVASFFWPTLFFWEISFFWTTSFFWGTSMFWTPSFFWVKPFFWGTPFSCLDGRRTHAR